MKITVQLLLLIALGINVLEAQQINNNFDSKYGLDPILYNGKDYTFFVSSSIEGHQFFESKEFSEGSLTIKGNEYKNLNLNYDIYNQQILLKYENINGVLNIIEISKAWLKSFRINGFYFELKTTKDNSSQIFQVIGNDNVKMLIKWQKSMKLETGTVSAHYSFTKPNRKIFLQIDSELYQVKSKRALLKLFNEMEQISIKKYLKKHKIKLKKASIQQMKKFISFCNTIN